MNAPALRFQGVSVIKHRRVILESVTFDVQEATVHALLGHNGAGKTTLLRVLGGLVNPRSGHVRAEDRPTVLFVGTRLPGEVRVSDLLEHRRQLLGACSATVAEVVDRTGIGEYTSRPAGQLSTGMTQRVALACALVGGPRTIVLDEPTTGLDPQGVEGLLRLVGDLRREGRTIVICSHDLAQLELVCDRVTCLRMGRVTADGWVNEVARNVPSPAHIVRTSDDVVAAKLLCTVGIECTIATRGLQVSSTQDVGAALGVLSGHVSVTEVTVSESLFARIYSVYAAAPGSRGSGETRR